MSSGIEASVAENSMAARRRAKIARWRQVAAAASRSESFEAKWRIKAAACSSERRRSRRRLAAIASNVFSGNGQRNHEAISAEKLASYVKAAMRKSSWHQSQSAWLAMARKSIMNRKANIVRRSGEISAKAVAKYQISEMKA
jgi:hypothetical protein